MYLEPWMLVVTFVLWLISLFDLWRTGVLRGVDSAINYLEDNGMLIVDYDEDGNRMIQKIKRVNDKDE